MADKIFHGTKLQVIAQLAEWLEDLETGNNIDVVVKVLNDD